MKLIRNISGLKKSAAFLAGSVVTIGNYDGVHLGHRQVLARLIAQSKKLNLPSVVVIFEPQPEEYFHPHKAPSRLMNLSEKLSAFHHIGLDFALCLRFDERLAKLSAEDFIAVILNEGLHVKYIVLGADFNFGSERKGDLALLKKCAPSYGFTVEAVKDFAIDGKRVSATAIRAALENGDLMTAKRYLSHAYFVTGRVVHGSKLGRDLGFPTANIALHCKVLPLSGVYIVRIRGLDDAQYDGIANIGFRPTIANLCAISSKLLEVYLFDFHRYIYRKKIIVEFIHKLRDEQKFANFDLLCQQIERDIDEAKKFLKAQ